MTDHDICAKCEEKLITATELARLRRIEDAVKILINALDKISAYGAEVSEKACIADNALAAYEEATK